MNSEDVQLPEFMLMRKNYKICKSEMNLKIMTLSQLRTVAKEVWKFLYCDEKSNKKEGELNESGLLVRNAQKDIYY